MEEEDIEGIFGECEPIGDPIFVDIDGRKFYSGIVVHNLTAKYGDCVRVKLDSDDDQLLADDELDNSGYCQIFAIYDDPDPETGVMIEVRWFETPEEYSFESSSSQKRMKVDFLDNELIETENFDDIPAGSIAEVITLTMGGSSPPSRCSEPNSSLFPCRFMISENRRSLQPIASLTSSLTRGANKSEYKHCYAGSAGSLTLGSADGVSRAPVLDVYSHAIRQLHISVVPDRLMCREAERARIEGWLRKCVLSKGGMKPLYISGMPGTGKTATILATVAALRRETTAGTFPEFKFVELNCLRLHSPMDAFTVLWRHISGQHASSAVARSHLSNYFHDANVATRQRAPVVICLLDELDFLLTKDENVIYSFVDWPLAFQSHLAVVGISNVMDLPERLSSRVQSRIGSLERIVFSVYNHEQIKDILLARLSELGLPIFDTKSMEFLARKAASVAGDLRAALKMCQRTIEIFRQRNAQAIKKLGNVNSTPSSTPTHSTPQSNLPLASDSRGTPNTALQLGTVSSNSAAPQTASKPAQLMITHDIVKSAIEEYKQNPFRATIRLFSQVDKAILVCICKHLRVTGELEFNITMVWERLEDLLRTMYTTQATRVATTTPSAYFGAGSSHSMATGSASAGAPATGKRGLDDAGAVDDDDDVSSLDSFDIETEMLEAADNDRKLITMRPPPYAIFEQAISRLAQHGILKPTSAQATTFALPRLVTYVLRPEPADIVASLQGDPFFVYAKE